MNLFSKVACAVVVVGAVALYSHQAHALTTINDCTDLENIINDLTEDYVLGGDIDCTGGPFTRIVGNFTGTLDGDGYTVDGVSIVQIGLTNDIAIFSDTVGATIRDITFSNMTITGNYFVGGIVAEAVDTEFINVHVDGDFTSTAMISLMGGIAGALNGGSMLHSSANVNMNGFGLMGGLVGQASNFSQIIKSYATGSISSFSSDMIGGLTGQMLGQSEIEDAYAQVDINSIGGGDAVGGLVGSAEDTAIIVNTYATGLITVTGADIGGLVGSFTGSEDSIQSYWDTDSSGLMTSGGDAEQGKTTAEMQDEDTFEGWDFTHIWDIDAGEYPTLVAYNPDLPVLTQVQNIPSRVTRANAVYHFSASEDGTYLFEECGAEIFLDEESEEVTFGGLEIGETYGDCSFYMLDDDDNVSNELYIAPFTIIFGDSSIRSGGGRSRAVIKHLIDKKKNHTEFSLLSKVFSRVLRLGSQGEDVRALQQFLNAHGFPVATSGKGSAGQETTIFGPRTQQALIKFQEAHAADTLTPWGGAKGTGIFGALTMALVQGML